VGEPADPIAAFVVEEPVGKRGEARAAVDDLRRPVQRVIGVGGGDVASVLAGGNQTRSVERLDRVGGVGAGLGGGVAQAVGGVGGDQAARIGSPAFNCPITSYSYFAKHNQAHGSTACSF